MLVLYICTMINAPVDHGEIRWALEVALSKFSKRSCDEIAELFATIFPYRCIARSDLL